MHIVPLMTDTSARSSGSTSCHSGSHSSACRAAALGLLPAKKSSPRRTAARCQGAHRSTHLRRRARLAVCLQSLPARVRNGGSVPVCASAELLASRLACMHAAGHSAQPAAFHTSHRSQQVQVDPPGDARVAFVAFWPFRRRPALRHGTQKLVTIEAQDAQAVRGWAARRAGSVAGAPRSIWRAMPEGCHVYVIGAQVQDGGTVPSSPMPASLLRAWPKEKGGECRPQVGRVANQQQRPHMWLGKRRMM